MSNFTFSEKELKKYLSDVEYYLVHEKFLISVLNKNAGYIFEKMKKMSVDEFWRTLEPKYFVDPCIDKNSNMEPLLKKSQNLKREHFTKIFVSVLKQEVYYNFLILETVDHKN